MSAKRDIVIVLGSGYVARFMLSLTNFYQKVLHTSREPHEHLTWVSRNQWLHFDLARPDTWENIPAGVDLLWCFPAAPLDAVQRFVTAIRAFGKLVVLGSTSAYDIGSRPEYPPPWIDETAPIDLRKPRVQGEEFLRRECGAVVLRVAGIYGPGRNPCDWINSGRVRLSDKYVNLIHAEDLADICVAALQCGRPGAVYNVSDGVPRTWREIGQRLCGSQGLEESEGEQLPGKRIGTAKLRSMLQEAGIVIRHPDLFGSLEHSSEAQ
jgi:hypothetical protein